MRPLVLVALVASLHAAPLAGAEGDEAPPSASFLVMSQFGLPRAPLHLGTTEVTLAAEAGAAPLTRLEIWDAPPGLAPRLIALCEATGMTSAGCSFREHDLEGGSGGIAQRFLVGYAYDEAGRRADARLEYARADVGAFRRL
jgi:hypothetical protein